MTAETYALLVSGLMSIWFALAFGFAWYVTGGGDSGCTTAQTGDENLCLDGG